MTVNLPVVRNCGIVEQFANSVGQPFAETKKKKQRNKTDLRTCCVVIIANALISFLLLWQGQSNKTTSGALMRAKSSCVQFLARCFLNHSTNTKSSFLLLGKRMLKHLKTSASAGKTKTEFHSENAVCRIEKEWNKLNVYSTDT